MNTPEPTPKRSRFTRTDDQIEEIDLTGSPKPRRPQKQRNHFDVELYILNHQQSRKNSTTIWDRDADDSFRATEHEDLLTYLRTRRDLNSDIDSRWADEKWKQWVKREGHPAVQAFLDYNEKPVEMKMLDETFVHLRTGEMAVQDVWSELSHVRENVLLAFHSSSRYNDAVLFRETREMMSNLASHLRSIESAHAQVTDKLEGMNAAVKRLLESKIALQKFEKRKRADDMKMVDTIEFVKECLDNHCHLVNLVLGQPDHLVQQGTDLMQSVLSEVFGSSAISESELELEPELESEAEPESEIEEDSEGQHDNKRQKRLQQPPVTRAKEKQKRQTKLVLGKAEKSRRLMYRSIRDQSATPDRGSESEVEHPKSVRRNPKRKAAAHPIYKNEKLYPLTLEGMVAISERWR